MYVLGLGFRDYGLEVRVYMVGLADLGIRIQAVELGLRFGFQVSG